MVPPPETPSGIFQQNPSVYGTTPLEWLSSLLRQCPPSPALVVEKLIVPRANPSCLSASASCLPVPRIRGPFLTCPFQPSPLSSSVACQRTASHGLDDHTPHVSFKSVDLCALALYPWGSGLVQQPPFMQWYLLPPKPQIPPPSLWTRPLVGLTFLNSFLGLICHNKLPRTWWLKTIVIYSVTVLEATDPKLSVSRAHPL